MLLIQSPDGTEQCLVESLTGYEGWVVLSEDAPPPSAAGAQWDLSKKAWVEDPKAAEGAARAARAASPDKLLETIEMLEARVAALEAKA